MLVLLLVKHDFMNVLNHGKVREHRQHFLAISEILISYENIFIKVRNLFYIFMQDTYLFISHRCYILTRFFIVDDFFNIIVIF